MTEPGQELLERMVAWRRHLHAHPEVGFEEHATSDFLARQLASFGLEVTRGIGGTGLVATLKRGTGRRAIGLRADMDALAIQETARRPHASVHPGRMHACGHDGHMALLLGAAHLLARDPGLDGTVHFVFQPAEEHGRGARAMIADGLFKRFPMDEIYGIHSMPGIPAGRFETRPGGMMASEDNFVIRIQGRGAHAARPHMSIDPIVIGAEIVLALQTVVARNIDPTAQAVVSVTEFITTGTRNVIPGSVVIKGDTRSYAPAVQTLIQERMGALVAGICSAHGAGHEFEYTFEFEPTLNSPECVAKAVRAARTVAGAENVSGDCPPVLASEDFGAFLLVIPGNYMFLGSGLPGEPGGVPLHSPEFDFNDNLLLLGARYFATIAQQCLAADATVPAVPGGLS
jgi:hippurate hydrolase